MPEIIINIDSDEDKCGVCELLDTPRDYCEAFMEFLDTEGDGEPRRCADCLNAEINEEEG